MPMNNAKRVLRCLFCILIFVLPFRFGSYVGNGEQPNFPLDIWEWAFFTCYPSYLPAIMSGLLLLVTAIICPVPRRSSNIIVPILWLLFLLAGVIGIVSTTELDYAEQWLSHFAGAAALCTAVWWASDSDEKLLPAIMGTIAVVGLLSCIHGWRQHFGGLEASLNETLEQARKSGITVTEQMIQKMRQTRVYGTMIDPNVYCAHLLFCMPFTLFCSYNWGKHFDKPRIGSIAFLSISAILFACAMYWSGSRGGAIGAMAAIIIAIWALPKVSSWKWRWFFPVFAVILAIAAFLLISFKSSARMGSASERISYYKAAVTMFCEHPFTGVGLGEFFTNYLRLKTAEAEITREPHNIILAFASQMGIFGAIAILLHLLFPWLLATFAKRENRTPIFIASITAMAAWFTHSCFQFNELIPGTLYLYSIGALFAFAKPAEDAPGLQKHLRWPAILLALLSCVPITRISGEIDLQKGEKAEKKSPGNGLIHFEDAAEKLHHSLVPERMKYDIFVRVHNWPKALETGKELTGRAPHRATSFLRCANVAIAAEKYDVAEEMLASAQEWFPLNPDYFITKAVLKYRKSHTLSFIDSAILAEQTISHQSWIHENENGLLVTFPQELSMLSRAINGYTDKALDGRTLRIEPGN